MDERISEFAKRNGFVPTEELPPGYCSRVYADATRILKAPFQGEELTSGLVAARRLSDTIGPRVHAWDTDTGAVLMDRILPGTPLHQSGLSDEACAEITLGFIRRMRHYATDELMDLSDYVDKSDPLGQELLSTTTERVFLHGDLHHENILLGPDGWVVIDPKGLIGDPAFEPSAFLRNPFEVMVHWQDLPSILEKRVRLFSDALGCSAWRIWAWSVVAIRDGGTEPGTAWHTVRLALESLEDKFNKGD